jgi:hypothetical protein
MHHPEPLELRGLPGCMVGSKVRLGKQMEASLCRNLKALVRCDSKCKGNLTLRTHVLVYMSRTEVLVAIHSFMHES